ncbi:hypothetical protein OF122_09030 [Pelagibacterium flavum]|uniref:Uncharacterized protein n=1 Tax=Pelagibacterium flavum TaxID=2984530 RepID=A0ABY6IX65_9HYPH|nr:hypothetical protein [Pelagibacterium sp. YIM 151497]UYQ73882.1 hypothetical protein OF122_09030 [Pelagibacterium sp. YIM 151497]|tara:strand:- start:1092 stop:1226 length:135 start_codon:yes stop_codon:yes gene_type:complete
MTLSPQKILRDQCPDGRFVPRHETFTKRARQGGNTSENFGAAAS